MQGTSEGEISKIPETLGDGNSLRKTNPMYFQEALFLQKCHKLHIMQCWNRRESVHAVILCLMSEPDI